MDVAFDVLDCKEKYITLVWARVAYIKEMGGILGSRPVLHSITHEIRGHVCGKRHKASELMGNK